MEDDGGLGLHNWGHYGSYLKGNLGLQLMSNGAERDIKPFISGREHPIMVSANGAFHHSGVSEPHMPMEFVRDGWYHQRERLLHMIPGNPSFSIISETTSQPQPLQMLPPDSSRDERVAQIDEEGENKKGGQLKKRPGARIQKSPKSKKTKKVKEESNSSVPRARAGKKNAAVIINGIDMDISGIPIPVCSCTGIPQQCYRWGCGGWQSACCTTSVSMYPLPMSTKRRGARIAGRKMSQGAFKKVLEKLITEGYNLSNPIDLRTYWAKHGTNKFVTIR